MSREISSHDVDYSSRPPKKTRQCPARGFKSRVSDAVGPGRGGGILSVTGSTHGRNAASNTARIQSVAGRFARGRIQHMSRRSEPRLLLVLVDTYYLCVEYI